MRPLALVGTSALLVIGSLLFSVPGVTAEGQASAAARLSASNVDLEAALRSLEMLEGQASACGGGGAADGGDAGEALAISLERGFFDSAHKLATACATNGIRVDSQVHRAVNGIRRQLTEVTALLQQAKLNRRDGPVTIVAPAFEWAQSRDSVFVGVKFAHKLDAPACIDLANEKISIEAARLSLSATCKGKHKSFSLELDLLDEVDPDKSSWAISSVGRGIFTLIKLEPDVRWHRLLRSVEKPRNMHTWWKLHEKYASELDLIEAEKKSTAANDGSEGKESEMVEPTEATTNATTAEADEMSKADIAAAAALESQRAELRKRARKDSKRAAKDAKKGLKAVESELKQRIKDIDAKADEERSAAEEEAEKRREEVRRKKNETVAQIDKSLAAALEGLEDGEAGGGFMAVYERMSSMLFGDGKEAVDVDVGKEEL